MELADSWMPVIAERLAAGQKVRYLGFRGSSMLPMLRQGEDSVELSPLPEKLKKYDLPVYRRADGEYIMHRVVAVRKTCYICLGDNTYQPERVDPGQLVGLVSAFQRGGKRIQTDDFWYGVYCRVWLLLYPIRKLLQLLKGAVYRSAKWIKGRNLRNRQKRK